MAADTVRIGDAIEGAKAKGSSREPLKNRGLVKCCGLRCSFFVASFDVEAQLQEPLAAEAVRINPDAFTDLAREIRCDKALIHSLDGRPNLSVGARTGRHQASFWNFGKQTSIKIDRAHQELLNAIQSRIQREVSLSTGGTPEPRDKPR